MNLYQAWIARLEKVSPESDTKRAEEVAYLLERVGDSGLSSVERDWLERRRRYCQARESTQRVVTAFGEAVCGDEGGVDVGAH